MDRLVQGSASIAPVSIASRLKLWIVLLAHSLRVHLEFMASFVLGLSSWTEIIGPTEPEVFTVRAFTEESGFWFHPTISIKGGLVRS